MSVEVEQYKTYRPGGREPNRLLRVLGGILLFVAVFGGAWLGMRAFADWVNGWLAEDQPGITVEAGLPVTVEIPRGSSAREIADILANAGVVGSAAQLENVVKASQVSDRLQAGVYELETGMPTDAVVAALLEGPGSGNVVRFTIIEGLTVLQTVESLANQTQHGVPAYRAALLNGSVQSELMSGPPDRLADWEGLLFPDTYEVDISADPEDVLQLLADTAVQRVASVDWRLLETKGFTPYQGIIIASMIEREAVLDDERPIISSVIHNRLDAGMLLQIDATVVYALGPEAGPPGLADLEIDSPYNTYRYLGLPPTPISGARVASLQAAAAPADTDFLFYVLADPGGAHAFTDDFDDFLALQEQARQAGLIP